VGAIVVNFNAGELLVRCVRSVLQSTGVEITGVVVADNGSRDGSVDAIAKLACQDDRVIVIENDANLGFAAANNRALPRISAGNEFLLFLNPDCLIEPDTLSRMTGAMREHADAGMAGCMVTNPDGSEQRGSRRNIPTPMSALVRVLGLDRAFPTRFRGFDLAASPLPPRPVEVEAVSGALILVRKRALDAVGPLDEGYFLHCEDLDWFMRFRQAGWRILYVPDAKAMHVGGASSGTAPVRVEYHKHRGMLRFYRKYYADRYPLPLLWLVTLAVWLRFLAIAAVLTISGGRARQR